MLKDRIKELRKQKGYSQETLAQQMNVVRQTVSKWENGTSVPDAEMLSRLAEVFDVPVSVLLGESISPNDEESGNNHDDIARQLAILNDQMAANICHRKKVGRTIKMVFIGVIVAIFLFIAVVIGSAIKLKYSVKQNRELRMTTVTCTLNGDTYTYEIVYDQNFRITEAGGDAFIADHVQTEKYDDANILLAQIEDYFIDHGGTFKSTEKSLD